MAVAASVQSHLHPHPRLPVHLDVLSSPCKDTSRWTEGPLELQDDLLGDLKLITPAKTLLLRQATLTGTGVRTWTYVLAPHFKLLQPAHKTCSKERVWTVDSHPSLDAQPFGEVLSTGFF